MQNFDKQNLKQISAALAAAIKSVSDQFNINLHVGSIRFTDTTFTAKVEGSCKGEGGVAITPESIALKKVGKYMLGEEFAPDAIYLFDGEKIKFVGIRMRSNKRPIVYERLSDGKKFITTKEHARFIIHSNLPKTTTSQSA